MEVRGQAACSSSSSPAQLTLGEALTGLVLWGSLPSHGQRGSVRSVVLIGAHESWGAQAQSMGVPWRQELQDLGASSQAPPLWLGMSLFLAGPDRPPTAPAAYPECVCACTYVWPAASAPQALDRHLCSHSACPPPTLDLALPKAKAPEPHPTHILSPHLLLSR